MPDEVLNLAVGLGKKLVMGFLLTYPNKTHRQIADMLGTTRNNVARVSALMKSECCHMETPSCRTETHSCRTETPYLVVEEVKEGQEIKPKPMPTKAPSLDEVRSHAKGAGRLDLADEFFHVNTDNDWLAADGQPIANWKSWFRGFAKRTPARSEGTVKRKKSMSMEDMLYAADAETQARKHNK